MSAETFKFIGRDIEISNFKEIVDSIKEGRPLTESVWFIYGVPLVGKTTLLSKVQNLARDRGIPTAGIDFDREKYDQVRVDSRYDDDDGKVRLAQDIMNQLLGWLDDSPSSKILSGDDPLDASKKLVSEIERIHNVFRKPVVLLFDTLEDVDHKTFEWLLRGIVQPIKDYRTLVVMAAKTHYRELGLEIDWSVLRKMRVHKLEPFDEELSREQIRFLTKERATAWRNESSIQFTGGIPGLNKEVVNAPIESADETLGFMVDIIFKRIVKRGIEDIRDELLIMSAVRQFDNRLLAKIAHHFWPEEHVVESRKAGLDLAHRLQETTLVQLHPDGYGYVIEPDVRRILDSYERISEKQKHFDVHCLAYRWFKNEVEKGDIVSLANQIYHLLALWYDRNLDLSLAVPDDIPDGDEREEQLKSIISGGLKNLDGNSRAETIIGKVVQVLSEKEFLWFFKNHGNTERGLMLNICEQYREQFVKDQSKGTP